MYKQILYSLMCLITASSGYAMLPGVNILTPACCTYTTMSFLCCLKCLDSGCSAHEYKKTEKDIIRIDVKLSKIDEKLDRLNNKPSDVPQPQKMTPYNNVERQPSIKTLKRTADQASMAGMSCLTPPLPRTSLDNKRPPTPPLLQETE